MNNTISILNDFSEYPGLRHCNISDDSGEEFYHTILNKKFKEVYERNEILTIILDGTGGYASSFLDEAFGNLVYDFTLNVVKNHIEIISEEEPHWKVMIEAETYTQWEDRRKNKNSPNITKNHNPWFRLVKDKVEHKKWLTYNVSKN